ncbi:site-specific integrase [Gluconobacter japonicus]|nr:site-specific integrase [Gluconobacter japonicus]
MELFKKYIEEEKDFLEGILNSHNLTELEHKTHEKNLREQISNLSDIIVSIKTPALNFPLPPPETEAPATPNLPVITHSPRKHNKKSSQALTIKEAAERFVFANTRKSSDTIKGTQTTIELFIEAFGDIPVDQITGKVAGNFQDLLLGLPSNHGKEKRRLPIRDAVQDAKERGLSTLSGKTAKNHFSRLSALWSVLVQREIVTRNPWMQWSFDTTKKTERRCWTDDELSLLTEAQWEHRTISQRTYAGIVMVALYTGMRLGEICNLRCQDIENIQEVACFRICQHAEDNWSPKSAAGIRIVPIHSQLISLGIMSFVQPNQHFLFPDLPTSRDGVRGAAFGQTFSRLKDKLGLPPEVAFHGFRHTVSTKLRNQNADIRELWIDRLLGHEASHRSQGTMNYTSSIDVKNLSMVIESLDYPSLKMRIPRK